MTLEEIDRIFSENNFRSLTALTLTGGEPTLRRDLAELMRVILRACPQMREVTLATNGLDSRRTLEKVGECLGAIPANSKVAQFTVQVSIDGIHETHDTIRGLPGYFDRVMSTIRALKQMAETDGRFKIRLAATVQPANLDSIGDLQALAEDLGFPIVFGALVFSPDYYDNDRVDHQSRFTSAEAQQASSVFQHLANADDTTNLKFYYRDAARIICGARRTQACMMGYYGFVLEQNGIVYMCVNCEGRPLGNLRQHVFRDIWWGSLAARVRREVRANCCPECASICYTLPANLIQAVDVACHRLVKRITP